MLFSRMSHIFLPQQPLQEVILVNLLVSRSLLLLCYAVIKLSVRTSCLRIHEIIWFPSHNPTLPISHLQIVKLMLVGLPVWIKSLGLGLLNRLISANYTYFEISAKAFKSQANFSLSAQLLNGGHFQDTCSSRNQSLARVRIFAFIIWVKSSVLPSFLLPTREHVK